MKINKNWKPKEFRTGIINPATGKEWILSDYYEDETGNRHFTHDEALKIWDSLPGWGPCTNEFHRALAELVWNKEADGWRENVNGTGLNGFEYMTQKLGYELGGFRDAGNGGRLGALLGVGHYGFSWSSTSCVSGDHYRGMYLLFGVTALYPSGTAGRAYGLQLRCLSE